MASLVATPGSGSGGEKKSFTEKDLYNLQLLSYLYLQKNIAFEKLDNLPSKPTHDEKNENENLTEKM
jgi:hypothetical protein